MPRRESSACSLSGFSWASPAFIKIDLQRRKGKRLDSLQWSDIVRGQTEGHVITRRVSDEPQTVRLFRCKAA